MATISLVILAAGVSVMTLGIGFFREPTANGKEKGLGAILIGSGLIMAIYAIVSILYLAMST